MSLYEKYRPKEWNAVIGQDTAVATIQRLAASGLGGRAFWIAGQSGTGKTTLARLIAAEVADPLNIEEIDAAELTAERIRQIDKAQHSYRLGSKPGIAYIVNEAHGMTGTTARKLLTLLEPIPAHVVWIFTTTNEAEKLLFDDCVDAPPLLSRCQDIRLSRRNLTQPFAEHARTIAQAEGLDGRPLPKYVELVRQCRNNLRQVIQLIEAGKMLS